MLKNNTTIYGQVISAGGLVVKAQHLWSMQENTNWCWKQQPLQKTITVPTCTILHPRLDVIIINMYKKPLISFVAGTKKKNQYKEIQLLWLMLIMTIFWMKLSVVKKLSLNEMWVLIVMRNSTDNNNNNAIFNIVFLNIMIKYQYVNVIWSFIYFSMFSRLLDSVMFILFKDYLVPICI